MDKNKRFALGMGISAVGLVIAALLLLVSKPAERDLRLQINEEKAYSTAGEVIDAFYQHLLVEYDMKGAIEVADTNVGNLDKEEASELIYGLAKGSTSYVLGELPFHQLMEYLAENKVRPDNLVRFMNRAENEDMKYLYDKLQESFVDIVMHPKESFIFELRLSEFVVDYAAIKEKYSDYVLDELSDYLMVNAETSWQYLNTAEGGIMYERVLENITKYESFLEERPDAAVAPEVYDWLVFQYRTYFGYLPGSQIFSEETGIPDPKALKSYEAASKMTGPIGQKALSMLRGLERSDGRMSMELLAVIEEISEVTEQYRHPYWYDMMNEEIPEEDLGEPHPDS